MQHCRTTYLWMWKSVSAPPHSFFFYYFSMKIQDRLCYESTAATDKSCLGISSQIHWICLNGQRQWGLVRFIPVGLTATWERWSRPANNDENVGLEAGAGCHSWLFPVLCCMGGGVEGFKTMSNLPFLHHQKWLLLIAQEVRTSDLCTQTPL